MVQYEWNPNKWESLSEMEWDASATEVVRDTTKGCSNAVDTLPFGLILKESANSSLSVWTQKVIEKGTKFGPLQGDIITENNSWKLRTAKRSDLWPVFAPSYHVSHYIDTSPLFGSNWMRYVAFPGASFPHNLVACQVENAIYFFARENIPAFTELKVWFHPNFFDRMKSSTVHNIPWTVERHPFQNHHNFFDANKISIHLQDLPLAPSFTQNRLHFLLNPLHEHASFDKNHLNKFSVNHFQRFHPPSLETPIPINGFLRSSLDDGFNSKSRINRNILMLKKEQEERKLVPRSNSYKLDSSNESSPNLMKHENTTPPNSASLESINSSNHSWSCSEASSRESVSLTSEERIVGRSFSRIEETSTSDGSPKKLREPRRKSRGVASLPYELPRKNGKTIYECRVCKKVCAQLSNLKVHMYTHTGERPYGCSQCPSRFTQKAHLQKHMSTHTGVKPFSCPICGKKSASSSNIKAHMKVHESR